MVVVPGLAEQSSRHADGARADRLLYYITIPIMSAICDDRDAGLNDPLLELPGYLLRRASTAALAELNERLAELDLRHSDVSLMLLIRENPGITQSQAGRLLDIRRANMVPLVGRLRKRSLIERTPVDGRSRALHLTAAGRALATRSLAIVQAFETDLIGRVPAKLRQSVRPILLALWGGNVE